MDPKVKLALVGPTESAPISTPVPDKLWTVKQAAEWLSLTEHALRTMLRRNQLPPDAIVRIGRRIRFRSDRLRTWLRTGIPA
jgi:excisionase family DNA binding protein